jgi:hypothetical protein
MVHIARRAQIWGAMGRTGDALRHQSRMRRTYFNESELIFSAPQR